MREFFKGWRRKLGCVTLVIACVLAAGWIRSLTQHEGISFRTGQMSDQSVISFQSAINWCWLDGSTDLDNFPSLHWSSVPHSRDLMVINPGRTWRWTFAGIGIHDFTYDGNATFAVLVIPYWLIVLPLTLLSAWLLLRKPQEAKSKVEPAAERTE